MSDDAANQLSPDGSGRRFYLAAWRWHFYAGLFVIPFMLMLAITGMMMLWFTTVAPEYGERSRIEAGSTMLTPVAQAAAALSAHPEGTVSQYIAPYDTQTPALVRVNAGETARMLAINPYDGSIVQDSLRGGTWNEWATNLHGTLLIGDIGDRLIEIAAGFGIMLVITGLYLWWPRGAERFSSKLVPSLTPAGRPLWKSLHQVTGAWVSIILLFFLVSGLAWAGIWGGKMTQAWSTFPTEKWDSVPLSDKSHASLNMGAEKTVPWALEQTLLPASGSDAGIPGLPEGTPVNLDSMYLLGRAMGMEGRFQISVPADETGVYTLAQDSMSYDGNAPTDDRTVHVDRYTGKILADVRYADYSVAGKAMAVGIALHEGQLGLWNLIVNAVFTLAIVLLSLSGIVMWWKRRPAGAMRLGAPPLPANLPLWKGAVVVMLLVALAFPLTGIALLAVLALDVLVIQRIRPLSNMVS